MNLNERSEILAALHRERAEVAVTLKRAQDLGALALAFKLTDARNALNEAIEEFQPDSPAPCEMQFSRAKF